MYVELLNIKNISKLTFQVPTDGVWLLTGVNGCGKTSLLVALYRMGYWRAFQTHYRASKSGANFDSYVGSQVRYSIADHTVTYKYSGQRWRPTPSKNKELIYEKMPFSSVYFIHASANRIEPYSGEITPRNIRKADDEVINFIISVLGDDKFKDLKIVKTERSKSSEAFILPRSREGRHFYFSEKNFSLGELSIIRLSQKIRDAQEGSLLLIDEIEMALHPKAQIRLFNELTDVSKRKNITVIFSTHSSSLIKKINRKNIIYISKKSSGEYISSTGVYPAHILGEIAYDDDMAIDFIFFVEDNEAKILLNQLINYYQSFTETHIFPTYKIVLIGGFMQVVDMLESSSQIFPDYVKRFAFLDKDVEEEALVEAKKKRHQTVIDKFSDNKKKIGYLPCTPEVGVIYMLEGSYDDPEFNEKVRISFNNQNIYLDSIIKSREYSSHNGLKIRERSKKRMQYLVSKIKSKTGLDENNIKSRLYLLYSKYKYSKQKGELKKLLSPVFNK